MSATVTRRPSNLDECLAVAQQIGMLEADARQWYADCEVCDWCRSDGEPYNHWRYQMILARDRLRTRAASAARRTPDRIEWQAELKRVEQRLEHTANSYYTDEEKKERSGLKARRKELLANLGFKA